MTTTTEEEPLAEFRLWVAGRQWRRAATMFWCPHSYTVTAVDAPHPERGEFERMVMLIRELGEKVRFGKSRFIKLQLDAYHYWSMGWPPAATLLINRARVDAVVLPKPDPHPGHRTLLTPKLKPRRAQPFLLPVPVPNPVGVPSMTETPSDYPRLLLELGRPHPRFGYPQLTQELSLQLTEEEVDKLPPAMKGYARRARRLADLVAGDVEIELKASPAPVVELPKAKAKPKRPTKKLKPRKR